MTSTTTTSEQTADGVTVVTKVTTTSTKEAADSSGGAVTSDTTMNAADTDEVRVYAVRHVMYVCITMMCSYETVSSVCCMLVCLQRFAVFATA